MYTNSKIRKLKIWVKINWIKIQRSISRRMDSEVIILDIQWLLQISRNDYIQLENSWHHRVCHVSLHALLRVGSDPDAIVRWGGYSSIGKTVLVAHHMAQSLRRVKSMCSRLKVCNLSSVPRFLLILRLLLLLRGRTIEDLNFSSLWFNVLSRFYYKHSY
jgi:hypothetical protein